jgi:hypothetical protein
MEPPYTVNHEESFQASLPRKGGCDSLNHVRETRGTVTLEAV